MPIPAQLTAGDSASWSDLPFRDIATGLQLDSVSYTLSYALRGAGEPITLASTTQGSGWLTTLSLAASATLVAGQYSWAALLTAANLRITVARGEVVIVPDLAVITAPNYDGRSAAEIALADAEAALANLSASGAKVREYTIGSRGAKYYTAAELIEAIKYWRLRVTNEQHVKAVANGLGNPRNLMVRFR